MSSKDLAQAHHHQSDATLHWEQYDIYEQVSWSHLDVRPVLCDYFAMRESKGSS